jgi:hypothetical protein
MIDSFEKLNGSRIIGHITSNFSPLLYKFIVPFCQLTAMTRVVVVDEDRTWGNDGTIGAVETVFGTNLCSKKEGEKRNHVC